LRWLLEISLIWLSSTKKGAVGGSGRGRRGMERRLEHEASELPLLPRRLSLSELSDGDVGAPISPLRSPGRRLLRSESTRLRANIAEHVQR